MKTKKIAILAVAASLFVGAAITNRAEETAKDGKTIYTEAKCVNCHSIKSEGIEAKNNKKDLGGVTSSMKEEDVKAYLKKESEINGKKHPFAFKGGDEDLTTLVKFLIATKAAE
ncbi:MAG: c-type cytochrome [Chloroflexota bacterium]